MAQFVNSGAVLLLLLASLAVLASAAPPKPSDWQLCGEFCALYVEFEFVGFLYEADEFFFVMY